MAKGTLWYVYYHMHHTQITDTRVYHSPCSWSKHQYFKTRYVRVFPPPIDKNGKWETRKNKGSRKREKYGPTDQRKTTCQGRMDVNTQTGRQLPNQENHTVGCFRNPAITSGGEGSLSHYLQGFYSIHPRWFEIAGFQPSTVGSTETNEATLAYPQPGRGTHQPGDGTDRSGSRWWKMGRKSRKTTTLPDWNISAQNRQCDVQVNAL